MINLFEYMRRRQAATDLRRSGAPPPWSDDPFIASKFFCSVVRDDDRTSIEAREYIGTLPQDWALRAALIFRLVNRVSTLRALVNLAPRTEAEFRIAFDTITPPIFNTSYRINVGGWWNLDGISWAMGNLVNAPMAKCLQARHQVKHLIDVGGIGPFLSYEIMQDLRWVWGTYEDEDEWCYMGPGAVRGMERIAGTYIPMSSEERRMSGKTMGLNMPEPMRQQMKELLAQARVELPHIPLNLFEIEHNLCEYDKYCRVATGETAGKNFKPKADLPEQPNHLLDAIKASLEQK